MSILPELCIWLIDRLALYVPCTGTTAAATATVSRPVRDTVSTDQSEQTQARRRPTEILCSGIVGNEKPVFSLL